jgi:hypothetical protein
VQLGRVHDHPDIAWFHPEQHLFRSELPAFDQIGDEGPEPRLDGEDLGCGAVAPPDPEHVLDDPIHAPRMILNDAHEPPVLLVRGFGFGQELGRVADGPERVATSWAMLAVSLPSEAT